MRMRAPLTKQLNGTRSDHEICCILLLIAPFVDLDNFCEKAKAALLTTRSTILQVNQLLHLRTALSTRRHGKEDQAACFVTQIAAPCASQMRSLAIPLWKVVKMLTVWHHASTDPWRDENKIAIRKPKARRGSRKH